MKPPLDTRSHRYTEELSSRSGASWKRLLDVQAPYRWNLRRLELGFVLDVGCGIGRNLLHLEGHGVGVDHNAGSVEVARERGCKAVTSDAFPTSPHARPRSFDSLLFAHVLEHMTRAEASSLVADYLPYLRPRGRVVLITPQEAGFRSDASHVEFMGFEALESIFERQRITTLRRYSFPLPRFAGRFFRHNEFVAIGRLQT